MLQGEAVLLVPCKNGSATVSLRSAAASLRPVAHLLTASGMSVSVKMYPACHARPKQMQACALGLGPVHVKVGDQEAGIRVHLAASNITLQAPCSSAH